MPQVCEGKRGPCQRASWLWEGGTSAGFGNEALEDLDDLLEVMGPPSSFILQKQILFLEKPWRVWFSGLGYLWLLKSLKLVWTIPVPVLGNVSGVMVSFPTPPSMLGAHWAHLPSACSFLSPRPPPVSVSRPLGFYQVCP